MWDGETIGRYRLLREIGRGGMGVVFEAIHTDLGSRVAIKMIDPTLSDQGTEQQRFLREARAAAQTRHAHAVSAHDIGIHEGRPYIVMELLEGETLAELIAREAPLSPARMTELLLPVLSAVMAAHEAGIVHRDLKPANIVLARRGGKLRYPVVTDFGVSKLVTDGSQALTGSHAILGTVHYMAPELTRSAGRATPLSDLYSIGVILYECATGRRPFSGSSPYELMHAIVNGNCPRPIALQPRLEPTLESIILRAMHQDPERRYRSMQDLGSALLTFGNAKTWAIWASEFDVRSECCEATQSDTADSCRVVSLNAKQLKSSAVRSWPWLSVPSAALISLVFFAGGWLAANTAGRARREMSSAVGVASSVATSTAASSDPKVDPTLTVSHEPVTAATAAPARPIAERSPIRIPHRSEIHRLPKSKATAVSGSGTAAPQRSSNLAVSSAPEFGSNEAPIIQ